MVAWSKGADRSNFAKCASRTCSNAFVRPGAMSDITLPSFLTSSSSLLGNGIKHARKATKSKKDPFKIDQLISGVFKVSTLTHGPGTDCDDCHAYESRFRTLGLGLELSGLGF